MMERCLLLREGGYEGRPCVSRRFYRAPLD
jgi:hypothetical protein